MPSGRRAGHRDEVTGDRQQDAWQEGDEVDEASDAHPAGDRSAVLGHASPEATNVYLSVDEAGLLQCVLPVLSGALK